jgi:hypothetical protein
MMTVGVSLLYTLQGQDGTKGMLQLFTSNVNGAMMILPKNCGNAGWLTRKGLGSKHPVQEAELIWGKRAICVSLPW